jgi:hypothetical protein
MCSAVLSRPLLGEVSVVFLGERQVHLWFQLFMIPMFPQVSVLSLVTLGDLFLKVAKMCFRLISRSEVHPPEFWGCTNGYFSMVFDRGDQTVCNRRSI